MGFLILTAGFHFLNCEKRVSKNILKGCCCMVGRKSGLWRLKTRFNISLTQKTMNSGLARFSLGELLIFQWNVDNELFYEVFLHRGLINYHWKCTDRLSSTLKPIFAGSITSAHYQYRENQHLRVVRMLGIMHLRIFRSSMVKEFRIWRSNLHNLRPSVSY